MSLYHLNVTLHVLAAMLWLGGMLFLAVVAAPVLRRVQPPPLRAQLFRDLGTAFRTAGWWAIAVLLVTGVLNLHFRGLLRSELLLSGSFWGTRYGSALMWKLLAVGAMLGISAVHDFIHGPAAGRAEPGSAEALRLRRQAAWMARANAVIGVGLVVVAVRLARGG